MKLNAGAWIGIIGGAIGLAAGMIAVIATAGKEAPFIAIGILAMVALFFFVFYRLFFKPMLLVKRLQAKGIPARAIIIAVKDSGVTINNNIQVKLVLELKNTFGQKYQAETRVLVSRINPGRYQPGMEVPVKVDPKNDKLVALDFSQQQSAATTAFGPTQDASALKAELEALQKEQEQIRLSGKPARAIIKKYTWLGAYVNGNNPYAELEMEVLPEHSSSFSGKTKAVISETSVSKYQPGCEIFVKYDLYDNSKISVDHS